MSGQRSGRDVTVVWALGSAHLPPRSATELLRVQVGATLGTSAADVRLSRSCSRCGSSDHGTPVVLPTGEDRPPFVSLSRAGEAMVVAVSECGPVGVDIERLEAARFAGYDGVALGDGEAAPTVEARAVTWVRKESLLKATGDGLQVDPGLISLSGHDEPPRLLEWAAPDPPRPSVWMQDLDVDGHAACVTVLSAEAPRFTVRQAAPEGVLR